MHWMLSLAVVASLTVTGLSAQPSLRDVAFVENGLFEISVADRIRKRCDTISARMLRANGKMIGLYDHARAQGYSDTEIETYVTSDIEKNRMKSRAEAYLASLGVVQTDPATYCAAGRAEIAKSSQIGALLRAR